MEPYRLRFRKAMLGYDNNPNNSRPNFNNNRPEQSEPAGAKEKGFFGKAWDLTVEHQKGIGISALVVLGAGLLLNYYCRDKHAKDQQDVNRKAENGVYERNDENGIGTSLIKSSEHEIDDSPDKWKKVSEKGIEVLNKLGEEKGGEAIKIFLNLRSYDGLLQCNNMPWQELNKVMGNPTAMRGFCTKDGTIKHAELTKVGMDRIAIPIVIEIASFIVSQYNQEKILEAINQTDKDVRELQKLEMNSDCGVLQTEFEDLRRYNDKKTFTILDMMAVQQSYKTVKILRRKYDKCLADINLDIECGGTEFNAAKKKKAELGKSNIFYYLKMATLADIYCMFAISMIVRIANYLGDEENVRMYSEQLDLSPWWTRKKQLGCFKNKVLEFVKEKYKSAHYKT